MSDPHDAYIANLVTERAALRERLRARPLTTITGVVGRTGPAIVRLRGQDSADLVFTLGAWREEDGRSEPLPLRVSGPATLLRRLLPLKPGEIVRIRAHLGETVDGQPEALLAHFTGRWMRDRRMVIERISQRRPVTKADPILGPLELDKERGWFAGQAEWLGIPIDVRLHTDHGLSWDKGADTAQFTAHTLWADQPGWTDRMMERAVRDLLEAHNQTWTESPAPIPPEVFKSRITLVGLECLGHREFIAWFDDGDLFWGHAIEVRGDLAKGPASAAVAG